MSPVITDIFPTKILIDHNKELADKLLPLCNKYTSISKTTLLDIHNYPSTLQNKELDNKINAEPLVIEALDEMQKLINVYKSTTGVGWEVEAKRYGFFSSMHKNAYLRKHRHMHCTFSGLLYLEIGEDVPPLIIHNPNPFEGGTIKIDAVAGRILIWPCWLEHELDLKLNDNPRKVFTFNI